MTISNTSQTSDNNKKLLFFDIDGTLAWPGKPASEATIQALKQAQANGHKIFLCTGRGESGVAPEIRSIGFDGGIYHSGSLAIADGIKALNHIVDPKLWQETVRRVEDLVMFYMIDCNTVSYKNKHYSVEYLRNRFPLPEDLLHALSAPYSKPITEYKGEDVYKQVCLCDSMEAVIELRKRLEDIATVTSYESFTGDAGFVHCDICYGNDTKATGMYAICDHYGMSPESCIAFGDGENDYAIIQAAGISVAMGNGDAKIKEMADHVCEHCLEDGIAKELVRLNII